MEKNVIENAIVSLVNLIDRDLLTQLIREKKVYKQSSNSAFDAVMINSDHFILQDWYVSENDTEYWYYVTINGYKNTCSVVKAEEPEDWMLTSMVPFGENPVDIMKVHKEFAKKHFCELFGEELLYATSNYYELFSFLDENKKYYSLEFFLFRFGFKNGVFEYREYLEKIFSEKNIIIDFQTTKEIVEKFGVWDNKVYYETLGSKVEVFKLSNGCYVVIDYHNGENILNFCDFKEYKKYKKKFLTQYKSIGRMASDRGRFANVPYKIAFLTVEIINLPKALDILRGLDVARMNLEFKNQIQKDKEYNSRYRLLKNSQFEKAFEGIVDEKTISLLYKKDKSKWYCLLNFLFNYDLDK